MTSEQIRSMIAENARRVARQAQPYDPVTGRGAWGERECVELPWHKEGPVWLPVAMLADAKYPLIGSVEQYRRLRIRYDFEFWAATCVRIRHKLTGKRGPFVLNAPQRRVLALLEKDRLSDRGVRMILLKARQWGGSTLVQMYFAWIQTVLRTSWNSLICAHVRNTSATIRRMYSTMLADYPQGMWEASVPPAFKAVAGAESSREIAGRDCVVTLASSYVPDAMRGLDVQMAHLSEVAFWRDSDLLHPEDIVRGICGSVPLAADTVIVLESTANGMSNFFHSQWLLAREGGSAYRAVFVPWYEVEIYRAPEPVDAEAFVRSLTDYEMGLWQRGCTLGQVAWYRAKSAEMSTAAAMMAEYPSDDVEAFASTDSAVFDPSHIEALRRYVREPVARGELTADAPVGVGALEHLRFSASDAGALQVWEWPDAGADASRYVVAVDVGGRSRLSDWSVAVVVDRCHPDTGLPAVVAQWRGHTDHDLLGWKAAALATWYAGALLVVESNTLESGAQGSSQYILEQLREHYANLYVRQVRDASRGYQEATRVGFHTNRATKALIVTHLIAMVRQCGYMERCAGTLAEMSVYEHTQGGGYAAKRGYHDDMLMTRAIALYVCLEQRPQLCADVRPLLAMPGW